MDNLINWLSQSGRWVDLLFGFLLIYFMVTSAGLVDTMLEMAAFLFSLAFSYLFYSFFGNLIETYLNMPRGISAAFGFFVAWLVAEILIYLFIAFVIFPLTRNLRKNLLNRLLGIPAAIIQTFLIFLFFVSLVFALPVRGQIKQAIIDSRTGPAFVGMSQNFERGIKQVFGGAVAETLNFLTVKPQSDETLDLGFKAAADSLKIDAQSENVMFLLVNSERQKNGLRSLAEDTQLTELARSYAKEMLINGFFSHYSRVDGSSPAQRAEKDNINYLVIGENLAYAPDVYLAHQGLMNSPGHRANILSSEYGRVGIGIVDAGVYGRMFVQEFKN